MAPASDSARRQSADGADQRRGLRRKTTAVTDVFNLEPWPPASARGLPFAISSQLKKGPFFSERRFILRQVHPAKEDKTGKRRQSSITLGKCFRVWCLTFAHCVAVLLRPRPHCAPGPSHAAPFPETSLNINNRAPRIHLKNMNEIPTTIMS